MRTIYLVFQKFSLDILIVWVHITLTQGKEKKKGTENKIIIYSFLFLLRSQDTIHMNI